MEIGSTSKTLFDLALDYAHSDFASDYLASTSKTHFDFALACLDWLTQRHPGLDSKIMFFKMDVRTLKTIAVIAGKWRRSKLLYLGDDEGEGERLECALTRIPHLVCSATKLLISDPDETEAGARILVDTWRKQFVHLGRELEDLYISLVDDYPLGDPDPRRLTDLIDSLPDISPDLCWYTDDLHNQLKALVEKLIFLKNFISFATMQLQGGGVERMQLADLLLHVEFVALNAARLIHMWWWSEDGRGHIVDTQVRERMQSEISQLIHKIQPDLIFRQTCIHVLAASKLSRSYTFTLEKSSHVVIANFIDYLLANLVDQLRSCTSFMHSVMNQMKILYEEVSILKKLFGEWQEKFNAMDDEIKDLIAVVVCDAGILIFSLSANEMKEGLAKETDIALCHLLKVVQFIMAEVAQIYSPTSSSSFSFPKTHELGFLDFLLENLQELASCEADSIVFVNGQIQTIQEHLSSLRSFLERIGEQRNKNEKLQALWSRVMEVAYKAEYVIDSKLVGDKPDCSSLSLETITNEIKFIKTDTREICSNISHDHQVQRVIETSIHMPSEVSTQALNEGLVGLHVEVKTMIDGLTRGSKQLDTVSIVGMPGLGKTTLANRVYNNPLIMDHFRVRAWCTVSQIYSKHSLLHQILPDNVLNNPDQDDLAFQIYKYLKRKRYLIVLDDVWDLEVWNLIKESFPDDTNGSRILFTSRSHNLSSQFKLDCKTHHLRILTNDESWELLRYKLFGKESCPPSLRNFGKQAAESCKGLPLAVVIVAGILASIDQNRWGEVAHSLSYGSVVGTEQCMKALELSYRHLPDYLKPCLLYFGAFKEDQDIPVRRLLWLWMSEGFVQKTKPKSLEYIAEDYLMELIGRSLVMVTQRRSIGGVKACRIHDLLHEFCVAKAKEESFMHILHGYKEHVRFTGLYNTHRLGIYSTTAEELEKSRLFLPRLRTLIFFDPNFTYSKNENSYNFLIFKLLRVLDSGFFCLNVSFLMEVKLLFHLRYLAICYSSSFIPPEIANLSRLETFLLTTPNSGSVHLPDTIWNMKKLRHLCVQNRRDFGVGFSLWTDNLEIFPDLCCLDTFTLAIDPSPQSLKEIVTKLPSIRRLKCWGLGRNLQSIRRGKYLASIRRGSRRVEFDSVSQLESLRVARFYGIEFVFPRSLKKLTLGECERPWNEISTVGELPNLEVLKLLYKAFVGETWETKEGEFLKLRFLKLENLEIVRWTAPCDNFPLLQKLILYGCFNLKELPALGDIPTIERIEVRGCHQSAVTLVKQIQEELGNDYLEIIIEESDSDSDSNSDS